jgi:uncharacterized membrane protein
VRDSVGADEQYLEQFRLHLRRIPAPEREEIAREITSHFAEARAQGRQVTEVIDRLGPPQRLARSYQTETILDRRGTARSFVSVFIAAVPAVSTSVASILIVPLLIASAVGLTLGGAATIMAGILSFVAPGLVRVDPATPFGQVMALVVGLITVGVGLFSVRALRWYLRVAVRTLRSGLLPIS